MMSKVFVSVENYFIVIEISRFGLWVDYQRSAFHFAAIWVEYLLCHGYRQSTCVAALAQTTLVWMSENSFWMWVLEHS